MAERGFGHRKEIHIWITSNDYGNANLMILIAYIMVGHKDWDGAAIKIMASYPDEDIEHDCNLLNLNKELLLAQPFVQILFHH